MKGKNVFLFTSPEGNKQIFAKEFKFYLPSKSELKKQVGVDTISM